MKTQIIIFLIALVLMLPSCYVDPDPELFKTGGSVTANLDGGIISYSKNYIYIVEGEMTLRSLVGEEEKKLTIGIRSGISKTTYDLGNTDDFITFFNKEGHDSYSSPDLTSDPVGAIVISKIDEVKKVMSGTFYSTLVSNEDEISEKILSNGEFYDVPYTIQQDSKGLTYLAKIDGVDLLVNSKGMYLGSSFVFLYGSGGDFLSLKFPNSIGVGSYDIGTFDDEYNVKYVKDLYSYESTSGTLTITKHDTQNTLIEGTFNVIVEPYPLAGESISITEGTFSVDY